MRGDAPHCKALTREMPEPFYIVGPTAVGKSEIAAAVAQRGGGEIVSADAFQIYAGLGLLTARPDPETLRRVPHHLIGIRPLAEKMDAEKFRQLALLAIDAIARRGNLPLVVGGTGMYVQALTHGLSPLPRAHAWLREHLQVFSEGELWLRLSRLDPSTATLIDRRNKRRLVRALEICLVSGRPASAQRKRSEPARAAAGVFLLRERAELYERIERRVKMMFAQGVVEEVREAGAIGKTAGQTLGLSQIRAHLAGEISETECIAAIQQATRRYAKRQLTWFRRQTSFEPLNLSHISAPEAIEWIARKARLSFAQR